MLSLRSTIDILLTATPSCKCYSGRHFRRMSGYKDSGCRRGQSTVLRRVVQHCKRSSFQILIESGIMFEFSISLDGSSVRGSTISSPIYLNERAGFSQIVCQEFVSELDARQAAVFRGGDTSNSRFLSLPFSFDSGF